MSKSAPAKTHEERILRMISKAPVQISEEEAQYDSITATASDYDKRFSQAFRERRDEIIQPGFGEIQHPTKRMFEIGIESIRQKKPSLQFLRLLEKIGNMAEDRDVMAALFPEAFRKIKKTTIKAAQRNDLLVRDFKAGIKEYLARPRTAKVHGDEYKGGSLEWKVPTYAEAMAKYKATLSPDKKKALDRALKECGVDVIDARDGIAEMRKNRSSD